MNTAGQRQLGEVMGPDVAQKGRQGGAVARGHHPVTQTAPQPNFAPKC